MSTLALDLPPEPVLSVFVPGKPVPQGSMKGIIHPSTGRVVMLKDSARSQTAWRSDIRAVLSAAWGGRDLLTGPIMVQTLFVMPRPVSLPKKRATPPAIKRPDADKLTRQIFDALTNVVISDDSIITRWSGSKRIAEIGETPGARITVTEIS